MILRRAKCKSNEGSGWWPPLGCRSETSRKDCNPKQSSVGLLTGLFAGVRGATPGCEMLAEGFLRLLRFREERKFAATASLRASLRCVDLTDPSGDQACGSASGLTDPVQTGNSGLVVFWVREVHQEPGNHELWCRRSADGSESQPEGGAVSTAPAQVPAVPRLNTGVLSSGEHGGILLFLPANLHSFILKNVIIYFCPCC